MRSRRIQIQCPCFLHLTTFSLSVELSLRATCKPSQSFCIHARAKSGLLRCLPVSLELHTLVATCMLQQVRDA